MSRLQVKMMLCAILFTVVFLTGVFLHGQIPDHGDPPFIMNPEAMPEYAGFSVNDTEGGPSSSIYKPYFQPREYVRILRRESLEAPSGLPAGQD